MEHIVLPGFLTFEWDEGNELKNWIKHKVSAKEAEDAFYDINRLLLEDIKHSKHEKRFVLFGKTKQGKKLFIVFTMRGKDNDKIRIISARSMKRKEREIYEKAIKST